MPLVDPIVMAVTDTPQQITSPVISDRLADRRFTVSLQNDGPADVRVGNENVTSSTGTLVPKSDEPFVPPTVMRPGDQLWIVTDDQGPASASVTVQAWGI